MAQQDMAPIKGKIMDFIEKNGPSLPAHVANEIGQSMLFSSAFLSELLSEKKLVMSHMKVGSSPVYFIAGQEFLLEKYSVHIKGKPGEAYALLKKERFLKDVEQLPAIRVALRSIKDFAKPFRFKDEIYWRYLTNSIEEFLSEKNEDLDVKKEEVVGEVSREISDSSKDSGDFKEIERKKESVDRDSEVLDNDVEKKESVDKNLDIFSKDDNKLFIDKIRDYFSGEKIVVLEETDIKKREFFGRGRMQSDIGEIEILIIGKDKKNIVEKDIEKAMKESVAKKMLVLMLSTGEITKKAKDIYREHKNLIRFVGI